MPSRRIQARETRREAAELAFLRAHPPHLSNGEETQYRNSEGLSYIANYSKGLPHKPNGEVEPAAYRALLRAIASGEFDDFERIPLGCKVPPRTRKLTNPQSGLAFDLEGPDAQATALPPAPRIDGAQNSAEMAELYWAALLRDVNFTDYGQDTGANTTTDAANSLTDDFTDSRAPRDASGRVTPATLFRAGLPGDTIGPWVSQFLLKQINYGTLRIIQRNLTARGGRDYLTNYDAWLSVQDGCDPEPLPPEEEFDLTRRYIRNGRDMATWVHFDALYEAYLNACLILLDIKPVPPFDPGNPYTDSVTQMGFGTFGGPHILSLVTEAATRALKAVWYQKWFVHRRLRPEAFGGLVHNQVKGEVDYPIDPEILNTDDGGILDRVHQYNLAQGDDTYLLPMAFPEGSPTHPAYGSGHATVAGACVTILKAWFDESFVIPNPQVANQDGTHLVAAPADTPPLTVGGELNKVASNIGMARSIAGVHWRTDFTQAARLGEAIAMGILEEQKLTYNEFSSLTFTTFDGVAVTI
jgi:hypothetical protein